MSGEPAHARGSSSEIKLRIASAVVLGALAIFVTWTGGILFAGLWCIAGAMALVEWLKVAGAGGLGWKIAGVAFAATVAVAPIVVRMDPLLGLQGILWLFAVVWGTDIMAFVVGRTLGGPKLWVRISPKKTWSGFIGGLLGGSIGGFLVTAAAGLPNLFLPTLLALLLSVSVHAGDLLESAVKRRFHVKDSGQLIPGHGGVMDRLDGFAVAAFLACAIGAARAGWEQVAQGFLMW
ncbi:phosphatidate cytidylyltransferase [Agaricicola taiwanensis]|uniref:Phosphatidate cytidylyltransferase n=1 Tax=Agaricicola taiwanensis TaxID=591372 RepID=A0A8J3DVA2_9RHOB|nr:phosphatidate cytidylyltransferase [Agaricicola taiwanensis]GGE44340.1 phosphatidate cytidylyltransferase [Agaricicola taiwanensis]